MAPTLLDSQWLTARAGPAQQPDQLARVDRPRAQLESAGAAGGWQVVVGVAGARLEPRAAQAETRGEVVQLLLAAVAHQVAPVVAPAVVPRVVT